MTGHIDDEITNVTKANCGMPTSGCGRRTRGLSYSVSAKTAHSGSCLTGLRTASCCTACTTGPVDERRVIKFSYDESLTLRYARANYMPAAELAGSFHF